MEMRTRGRKSVIMLLTKRPDRMLAWQREHFPEGLPSWVWVGCTVEDQRRADERVPVLLLVKAAVRFLSCEPLLGPVELFGLGARYRCKECGAAGEGDSQAFEFCAEETIEPDGGIAWVIAGGESGPKTRPSHPEWFRSLRDQCAKAGVPFLLKQIGEWAEAPDNDEPIPQNARFMDRAAGDVTGAISLICDDNGRRPCPGDITEAVMVRIGKHKSGRKLDGITHDGFPEVDDG